MHVLISGASIAGPVLAYWLTRYGFAVTVVERAPALRKTGGHAVDLFRPALEISEKMGVLPRVEEHATSLDRMWLHRQGVRRPVRVDLAKISRTVSDRHVEIMRDDLSEIYYDAVRDDAEFVFGDSITAIGPEGEVTFERGRPRRFDLVVGADGLHSNVRRLVFGEESRFTAFLGAYLAAMTIPAELTPAREYVGHFGVGRLAAAYETPHGGDARAVFVFRRDAELDYHHRDIPRQMTLLREAFTGMHPDVDRWLAELDRTPAFYFDSVTQIRLDTWSRGRVTLVGDAGYGPGPAVGGSTSLAVITAYTLAGELAEAGGDHERAYPAYERRITPLVHRSRAFASRVARSLIPNSRLALWGMANSARLISALPAGVSRTVARLNSGRFRMHDSLPVKPYAPMNIRSGERSV